MILFFYNSDCLRDCLLLIGFIKNSELKNCELLTERIVFEINLSIYYITWISLYFKGKAMLLKALSTDACHLPAVYLYVELLIRDEEYKEAVEKWVWRFEITFENWASECLVVLQNISEASSCLQRNVSGAEEKLEKKRWKKKKKSVFEG